MSRPAVGPAAGWRSLRAQYPRSFLLYRRTDPSGISGTGVIAVGALFCDGTVALHWLGEYDSTAIWPGPDGLAKVTAVHGHDGATVVLFSPEASG